MIVQTIPHTSAFTSGSFPPVESSRRPRMVNGRSAYSASASPQFGFTRYVITFLPEILLAAGAVKAFLWANKAYFNRPTIPVEKPATAIQKKRTLITTYNDSMTGFELLNALYQKHMERAKVFRVLEPYLIQASLEKKSVLYKEMQPAMEKLWEAGYLQKLMTKDGLAWAFTSEGKAVLAKGNPLETGEITKDDMHELLQMEIDDLENGLRENERFVLDTEQTYGQASLQYREWREKQEATKAQAITLAKSEATRTQAEEKAMQAKAMQMDIDHHREMAERLKTKLDVALALHRETKERVNAEILKLQKAQVRLKMAAIDEQTLALLKKRGMSTQAESLLDTVERGYHKAQGELKADPNLSAVSIRGRVADELRKLEARQALNEATPKPLAEVLNPPSGQAAPTGPKKLEKKNEGK